MRLDVALVVHRRIELTLDDDVGLGESGVDVTLSELDVLRGVRLVGPDLPGRALEEAADLLGHHPRVQLRRARAHCLLRVEYRLQDLVVDLDELECVLRDVRVGRGHRHDRVPAVQRLVVSEHLVEHLAQVAGPLSERNHLVGLGAGKSVFVTTARTPGSASAFEVSMPRMLACACGLRRMRP